MKRKLVAMAISGAMLLSMVPAGAVYADEAESSASAVADVSDASGEAQADVAPQAGAEDVVVHTSIGEGQVIFTKTDEAADITAEELTERVKEALRKLGDLESFNAFLDTEADVTLKLGEEEQLGIQASAIASYDKYGHKEHGSFFYSLNGLGEPKSGQYETYHFEEYGIHYTAVSDGSSWKLIVEEPLEEFIGGLMMALDSTEVNQIALDGLLPTRYEEDGQAYYVCVMDKDALLRSLDGVGAAQGYLPTADSILGDSDIRFTVVVNAETGLIRAISLDASGASGQIAGELMGAESAISFGADQLYSTFLLDPDTQDFEIPSEVLHAPVEEKEGKLGNILSGLGSLLSGKS